MKDQSGLTMNGCEELKLLGMRRPKTAVWKVPCNDPRRANFSKSAPGSFSEQQLFTPHMSSSSSFRTSQLSSASDLQHSFSSCPGCSKLSKMLMSPSQLDSRSAATSELHLTINRWSNACYGSIINLENGTQVDLPSASDIHRPDSGGTVEKLPQLPCLQDPRRLSSPDGIFPTSLQNMRPGIHSEQASADHKQPWYIAVLNEKERFLLTLGEEVTRLSKVEEENLRKDTIIAMLQHEVHRLRGHLQHLLSEEALRAKGVASGLAAEEECKDSVPGGDAESTHEGVAQDLGDLSLKLSQYEVNPDEEEEAQLDGTEEDSEEQEDEALQSSEENLETPRPSSGVSSAGSGDTGSESTGKGTQTEKDEVLAELGILQNLNQQLVAELEQVKTDYDICTGVVSSLQRQCAIQESQLRKADSNHSKLLKEFKERGLQLQAMSNKFSNLREECKHEEMMAAMEKESYGLREGVAELTAELEKRNSIIGEQKNEIQNLQAEDTSLRNHLNKVLGDSGETQIKADALEYLESQLKVALEATNAKFERFRSKMLQVTYSTPGTRIPLTELSDDEILEAMQKVITDRADFHQQLIQKGVKMPPLSLEEPPATAPVIPATQAPPPTPAPPATSATPPTSKHGTSRKRSIL
ncbi:coiled-coil domain-containing protein 27 [Lissotriton helveticus]